MKIKIENALRRATKSEASHIDAEVDANKLILRGRVRWWTERSEVERAAWAAPGVGQVEDNLTIAPCPKVVEKANERHTGAKRT